MSGAMSIRVGERLLGERQAEIAKRGRFLGSQLSSLRGRSSESFSDDIKRSARASDGVEAVIVPLTESVIERDDKCWILRFPVPWEDEEVQEA